MSTRSIGVYEMAHEAGEKFDYFVCSIAGALFAYIAQTYSPQRIELGISALEPFALLLLAFSFFVGLKRIEARIDLTNVNHRILDASEKAGELAKALVSPDDSFINEEGGEVQTRQKIEKMRLEYMKEADKLSAELPSLRSKALHYYKTRNIFLLLGFLTIFVAKVLQPYRQDSSIPANAISVKTNTPAQIITIGKSTNKPPTQ